MRKALKTALILTIIINSNFRIFGQELRGLQKNFVVGLAIENKIAEPDLVVQHDTLQLPFFEDFSDYGWLPLPQPFPKASKWSDTYAFINSEFADSMISIGVATLDAFDQFGVPYPIDSINKGHSDTLTSNFFNIDTTNKTPLYLSFFYQAGGKGNKPEVKDSLFVDFYTPQKGWLNSWQKKGGTEEHTFTQVIWPIPNNLLADNFRFRFRNRTSKDNENEDMQSNADQWHIDYIQLLRTNRPDTLTNLNDVTVMAPLLPSLLEFSSVPYPHLDMAQSSLERNKNPVMIRTYFPERTEQIRIERTHFSYDLINKKQIRIVGDDGGIANEMLPMETSIFNDVFSPGFSITPGVKSGKFEITTFFNASGVNQKTVNDTIKRREYYSDYYAYDDGSAEFGFGISGESQGQVFIAERFRILRKSINPDTLKGVYIFFNRTSDATSHTNIQFNICVWKNNGAKPGELLYQSDSLYSPDIKQDHINDFTRIELETPLLVSDTIFVGIRQENTEFVSIGYDINYNSLPNLYLKTSLNDWYNPASFPKGSVMIRPSFGIEDPYLDVHENSAISSFVVYPNPTGSQLNFTCPMQVGNDLIHIRIINIMGSTIIDTFTNNNSIDVSSLNTGMYMAVFSTNDGSKYSTVKFIKK